MKANWIDKTVAYFSPEAGYRRAKARAGIAASGVFGSFIGQYGGQYTGASQRGNLAGFNPRPGGPRSDELGSLRQLRARSRDMERNNPLAGGALASVVTNVIGAGVIPIPRLDAAILKLDPDKAAELETQIGAEFDLLAESRTIDITGDQDFYGLQDLTFRSTLASGDCFSIPRFIANPASPYELAIQVVEADRCMNPDGRADGTQMPGGFELVGGCELDSYGRKVAFWFSDRHPGEVMMSGLRFERIPAYGAKTGRPLVLQHFRRTRPGQVRGVPFLAPVIDVLLNLGRYSEAEIVAAVANACFAITTTTPEGDGVDLAGRDEDEEAGDNGFDRGFLSPGQFANLMPGEQLASFLPNRPNTAFDPFMLSMLRWIGVGLEIPLEVLIKHFTASYSAARGALIEAFKMYNARRAWHAGSFSQPIYEMAILEGVARGRLPDLAGALSDPAYFKAWTSCDWIGPPPGQLDEQKEVGAAKMRVDEEFSTRQEETARLTGGDWRRKHRQRVIEERARRNDGTIVPDQIVERDQPTVPATDVPPDDQQAPDQPADQPERKDAA